MINEIYVKKYCCEDISNIENYDNAIADTTQTWDIHHRLEIQGPFTNSPELLKKCGMYYAVPAAQLIFLTRGEHMRLHNMNRSDETREKMSESMKGEKHPMFGKHHSEEAREKMSAAHKGKPTWNKGKHLSEETLEKLSESLKGRQLSKEHKQHLSEAMRVAKKGNTNVRGKKWFNNGVKCVRARECPQGFILGRLSKKK